ncbi:MAG TPA: sigma 54-interacting transcriptional regulator [Polyangiaceae bacterium]
MSDTELPSRYEPLARLGQGGGGEVWAVRDRYTRREYALKVLAGNAGSRELAALVREAVSLSGLEGLGVPRVVRFGRLPQSRRPFLLRELAVGQSLEELMHGSATLEKLLAALVRAADQLTQVHRAGLLHGDVKPANVIVETSGAVTFVDLGLAAPLREGGAAAEGLTPRYAAPELFDGRPLTVRAEVYALGVTLGEILDEKRAPQTAPLVARELAAVAKRATAAMPDERYPSVDELAMAVRRAAGLPTPAHDSGSEAALWPIVGIDATSSQLFDAAVSLANGAALRIVGPPLSGRSALLRRLAWSLGSQGQSIAVIDEPEVPLAVTAELEAHPALAGVLLLVDDADALEPESVRELDRARGDGARLVLVGGTRWASGAREFEVPPLDERASIELVRRAVPSLTEKLQKRVVAASGGYPGELRRLVRLIATDAVASPEDIERKLGSAAERVSESRDPLERALVLLDRGRYTEAKGALELLGSDDRVAVSVARARLDLGLGEPAVALAGLRASAARLDGASEAERRQHALYLGRSLVGTGAYAEALSLLEPLPLAAPELAGEALAYGGLALSMLGRHDEARARLLDAEKAAEVGGSARLEALVLLSLGLVLQRGDQGEEARRAYERSIEAAERAGDAGTLASVQLNLAGLLKVQGDIAGAIEVFEAAADMGRRSGRQNTVRWALLNLANTDLYLGRLGRARASLDTLEGQREKLAPVMVPHLLGANAELQARLGERELAVKLFDECADAHAALGHAVDEAEARLEAILVVARAEHPELAALQKRLEKARQALGESRSHKPLLLLATARVAELGRDDVSARRGFDAAIAAARTAGQKEWIWRALEARAALEEEDGQPLLARRDREEALAVLEEIGARLPRDLREVYWNDPRRRKLRSAVPASMALASTELSASPAPRGVALAGTSRTISTLLGTGTSQMGTPLEQKLARILEVNSELAGELDIEWLTARITGHAVELARAERGFVILRGNDGELTVHAARGGSDPAHAEFSRSIAHEVIESREPVVAVNARNDSRVGGYASVHQMMLESVACVPILAPDGHAVGALYVETRLRPGSHFEREMPTLRAFADQVAIALENARLVRENLERADALLEANASLEEARARLKELLGDRTEQLRRTRQKLRDARETLYGHFGYQGLVGTSDAMRRIYALIERLKDTDVPVLITGESGTGKEMVARAIHASSARANAKFLGVNCGAIPENLLESELFGHVKGSFTGADRDRKGLFRECQGGTILLDEIGETPKKMQASLLRVLQEKKVRPVGGTTEEDVDVRVIFATNKDLEALVKKGEFREDLYYRIHVVETRLPSLRERGDDIPQLVDHFLGLFAARYKREKKTVARDAIRRLASYAWPGNVRQLENVLLNALVMSEEPELVADDIELPDGWVTDSSRERARAADGDAPRAEAARRKGTVSEHRREERERILSALRSCNWNRVRAAELSGIPRRTFYRRLREYGIQ